VARGPPGRWHAGQAAGGRGVEHRPHRAPVDREPGGRGRGPRDAAPAAAPGA
jgi:hypothetical protein